MFKYELHCHTAECDKCAELGGRQLVRAYYEKGYSGMVITDHYFAAFYDWFSDELGNKTKREIIHRWQKGYFEALDEGKKLGFTVLPGAEVRIDGTINDYLIYGLYEDDFLRLPLLNRMDSIESVLAVLPPQARVVQAHPFRNNMTVADPTRLFGIEVYNGGTEPFRNSLAQIFAEHYKRAATSGSDCHGIGAVGKGGIETSEQILSPDDLVRILDSGNYSLIKA